MSAMMTRTVRITSSDEFNDPLVKVLFRGLMRWHRGNAITKPYVSYSKSLWYIIDL